MTTKKKAAPKLTLKQKVKLLTDVLIKVQAKRFREPDSDAMEYCAGCGRSPYNVPTHELGCIVVEISRTLAAVHPRPCRECGHSSGTHARWCLKHADPAMVTDRVTR